MLKECILRVLLVHILTYQKIKRVSLLCFNHILSVITNIFFCVFQNDNLQSRNEKTVYNMVFQEVGLLCLDLVGLEWIQSAIELQ